MTAGTYTFTVRADDGLRLYVDGKLVLDKWIDQSATTYTVNVPLTAGTHTVVMQYYENTWDATAHLSISNPA
jgi:type IV pilus assembly protein PilY1